MNLINDKPDFNIGDVVTYIDSTPDNVHPMVVTGISVHYNIYDEPCWYYQCTDTFWGTGKAGEYGSGDLKLLTLIPDDERWYIEPFLRRIASGSPEPGA